MRTDYGSQKHSSFGIEDVKKMKHSGVWREIPPSSWLSLLVGLAVMLIAGTGYAFSAWSDDLKNERGYSQTEIELVGSLGNTGLYMAAFGGMIFDSFGVRITSLIGAALIFFGYFLMHLTTRMITPGFNASGIQGFMYLVAQFGSITLYITALSTNVIVFPNKYRGLVIGILVSIFGLSATMYTGIYNGIFNSDDLAGFQLMMAIANLAVGIFAAFLLPKMHKTEDPAVKKLIDEDRGEQTSKGKKILVNLLEKIISIDFWLLFWAFFMGYGAGLLHTNNLGQLTKSLNNGTPADDAVLVCVTLFSVFNAVGRLGMAAISDMVSIKRGWFFVISMGLMAIGHLLAALIFEEETFTKVYGITILIGTAYGGLGSITPTLSSDLWGTENFAQNWGWILIGAAGASYAFNGAAGGFYDREIANHPGEAPNECISRFCFRKAYFLSAGLSLFGMLVGVVLAPRTKKPQNRIRLESIGI